MRELHALLSNVNNLKRRLKELEADRSNEIARLRSEINRHFQTTNTNIKRIAVAPVVRPLAPTQAAPTTGNASRVLKLPKSPRDLYILWREYEFGREGIKPAKLLTAEERGRNKSAYCRHKVFWDTIVKLVDRGYTCDTAVDKIYAVYGRRLCVSDILKKMSRDRAEDTWHPDLL